MPNIKVTAKVVNRWGKSYVAKDWVITVEIQDMEHFKGFDVVAEIQIAPKPSTDESKKKRS